MSLSKGALLLAIVALLTMAMLVSRRFSHILKKGEAVFRAIAVMITVLFIYNFAPHVAEEISIAIGQNPDTPYELKTDFVVDGALPHPDVYWLHMDEMMGFAAIEKYYGDGQEGLKQELAKRGFVINDSAELRIGFTLVAVPALTSPTFYDSYLKGQLSKVEHLFREQRERELAYKFRLDRLDIQKDIAPNLELFHAYMACGYTAITISPSDNNFGFAPIGHFYESDRDEHQFLPYEAWHNDASKSFYENVQDDLSDLIHLLKLVSPLSLVDEIFTNENPRKKWLTIPEHEDIVNRLTEHSLNIDEERQLYRTLFDSFSIPSPKFVYVANNVAHAPYDKIYKTGKLENPSPGNNAAVDLLYLPQWEYAARVMLVSIDMILEQNPDAVIVIQADHGIQASGQRYMIDKGYPDSQILETNYSVIGAVRVPPGYGELPDQLEPLNVSRWLVNSFVGKNYELLQ
nr:hypothetical protein [uncultured bacterium]